jgi:dihydrodipicolinate synthase/N-acetylneuraminate lyase
MRFEGIIPAVTTPFGADGEIDRAALDANLASLLDAGVHGLVANGTMGEAGSLSGAERRVVIDAAVAASGGRVPAAAIALAADAADSGADAAMLLPPLGYRADPEELVAYYAAVAQGGGLPIMAYNNPEASGVDMPAELLVRLAQEVDGVVAVKECSGDARRIPALLNAAPGLEVLVGGDDWALEGFCAGATGWVSGVADVAPAECIALWEACRAGELERARELYGRLLPLARFDMTPKLVQYFKAAMDERGFTGGDCRPPRLPLTTGEHEALRAALAVLEGVPA